MWAAGFEVVSSCSSISYSIVVICCGRGTGIRVLWIVYYIIISACPKGSSHPDFVEVFWVASHGVGSGCLPLVVG